MSEDTFRETWKNSSAGYVALRTFGPRNDIVSKQIRGGETFTITTEERTKLNIAAEPNLDPFRNGLLTPVILAEDGEDLEDLEDNPNVMTETELEGLVTGHHKTLEKKLAEIDSIAVLQRMAEVAVAEDVSLSRVQKINDRLDELGVVPSEGPYKKKAFPTDNEWNPIGV